MAICGGSSGGSSGACVLTWPGLECIARVQQEVVGCWLEGGGLLCSTQLSMGEFGLIDDTSV